MGKLDDRVAVITGGNSGIGLAMARLFAAEGAKVVITGRRQRTLDDALREIGPGAVGVQGDVVKLADLDRLTAGVERRFGAIDVYVANAGVNVIGPYLLDICPTATFEPRKLRSDICFRRLIRTKCCPAARHLSGSSRPSRRDSSKSCSPST
jgi:NAD(P)-dependent dehydrogenase (short-subunit alcohol dehydrogenase family)